MAFWGPPPPPPLFYPSPPSFLFSLFLLLAGLGWERRKEEEERGEELSQKLCTPEKPSPPSFFFSRAKLGLLLSLFSLLSLSLLFLFPPLFLALSEIFSHLLFFSFFFAPPHTTYLLFSFPFRPAPQLAGPTLLTQSSYSLPPFSPSQSHSLPLHARSSLRICIEEKKESVGKGVFQSGCSPFPRVCASSDPLRLHLHKRRGGGGGGGGGKSIIIPDPWEIGKQCLSSLHPHALRRDLVARRQGPPPPPPLPSLTRLLTTNLIALRPKSLWKRKRGPGDLALIPSQRSAIRVCIGMPTTGIDMLAARG